MTNSVTTPQAIEVNLNDRVLFVLTDFGNECWDKLANAEMVEFNASTPRQKEKATLNPDDPTLKMQLWDFANFFGPKLFVGSPNIFVDNTVKIERS
jgi:hypothetical protein